jgi:transposase
MVDGTQGSHTSKGSTKMSKHIMVCAGIDTGKGKLDVALDGCPERLRVENTAAGHAMLAAWLSRQRVGSESRRAAATSRPPSASCAEMAFW